MKKIRGVSSLFVKICFLFRLPRSDSEPACERDQFFTNSEEPGVVFSRLLRGFAGIFFGAVDDGLLAEKAAHTSPHYYLCGEFPGILHK